MISVVVPIYNVEKYLEKCIDSIINQTYKDLEIILVDDGSTDSSGKIADRYAKLDSRIKVIHKSNGGLSDARNKGVEIANGEFISFIDSDDYIDLNMYEQLVTEIGTEFDVIVYGRYVEYENYTRIECPSDAVMNNREALIALASFKGFDMAAWDKLYKKEVVENIKFPFGKKNEDYFYTYKAFDKAKKIKTISKPYYHYVQRQNSISRSKNIPFDAIEGSIEQVEYFKEKHPDLIEIAYTTLFFSYVSIYNVCIKQHIELKPEKRKEFKKGCKEIIKYVLKNKYISISKKFQAILFITSFQLYKVFFKLKGK